MLEIMRKLRLIVVALILLAMNINAKADNYVKREMRSVWLTTVWALDWPSTTGTSAYVATSQKNEMIEYLDQLKNDGFNAVFFQVRSMADAFYKSSYEPWSSYLTGTRGATPSYDPLAFVVEECHKRGLECHAWVNPYRYSTGDSWSTTQDRNLTSSGWLLSYTSSSDNNGTKSTTTIFNPGLDAARQRIIDVCSEIVNNYDVDGLVFDDYFYPNGIPENSTAGDYTIYKNSGSKLSMGDWRRDNVNKMVQGVYDMIQSSKPWVRFGIAPAGAACSSAAVAAKHGVEPLSKYCSANDWQYDGIYSDPVQWLEDGSIDYISPQLYWVTTHSTNPFGPMTQWWSKVAKQFGRHHYASHSISFLTNANTASNWAEVGKQVQLSRDYTENDAAGCVFYRHGDISGKLVSGLGEWLYSNKFQAHALPPAIDWKNAPKLDRPTGFVKNGNILSWNSMGENVKYSVYAIPDYYTKDQVQSTASSGIDANYLLGITYDNTFEISDGISSGFYYAVCAVDRYNNEYEPRYSNSFDIPAAKVTLLSPVQSATVKPLAIFTWTAVEGATFRLQISKTLDFSSVEITVADLTSNTATVDITSLDENKTYYWRVITSESEKEDTASDTATFVTPVFESAPVVSLLSPGQGSEFDAPFDFVFTSATVDGYVLEVSQSQDFTSVVKTVSTGFVKDGNNVKYTFDPSELSNGYYFWRVKANKAGFKSSISSVSSFVVNLYGKEDGYEAKQEQANYSLPGDYSFENLWIRSVNAEYNNLPARTDWGLNRGMCVIDGVIYVAGRVSNSSSSDCYLDRYSVETGEFIGQLKLSSDVQTGYFPCNDVLKDDDGNLIVSNLTINVSTTPLVLYKIDKITGEATLVKSMTHTSGVRVDHCAVSGSVTSGDYYVLAGAGSSNKVIKWTYSGGNLVSSEQITVAGFYPQGSDFGLSVRVYLSDDNRFFVNASKINPTLYDEVSGDVVSDFSGAKNYEPENVYANGFAHFSVWGENYVAYSSNPVWTSDAVKYYGGPHQVKLANVDQDYSFSSITPLVTVPSEGLGSEYSFYADEVIDYEYIYNHEGDICGVNLCYYVPVNGLAAYRFIDNKAATLAPDLSADRLSVVITKNEVRVNKNVDIEVFTVSGARAAYAVNTEKLSIETLEKGLYIVKCSDKGQSKVIKFVK